MPFLLASLFALATTDGGRPPFHWRPFLGPAPLWADTTWPWLLVPLCVAVAVVYKSVKCSQMRHVPREAFRLSVLILFGMVLAAVILMLIVHGLERANP